MLSSSSSSCFKATTNIITRRSTAAHWIARATTGTPTATTTLPITTNTTIGCTQRRTVVSYAAVNHAQEYKDQMDGRHGLQLQLAIREGNEKSDGTHFNPFEAYAIPEEVHDEDDGIDDIAGEDESIDTIESSTDSNSISDSPSSNDDEPTSTEDEDEDEEDEPESILHQVQALYHPDGSPRSLTQKIRNTLRAGAPAGGRFAIIHLAGSQHKVTTDDLVILSKLRPVSRYSVGSTHILTDDEVLLMGDRDTTLVGLPYVKGAEVEVMVEEITRDKTVDVFKKRRRKNSRRKNGFRREVTFLRILGIRFPEKFRHSQTSESNASEAVGMVEE
mmetsp:Transcript_7073/g.8183  ORF Transcript_7073/g.8183 Transcript_7073/m.8183 type:complete len:332 (-) Transcript_7073:215-1210(-)